MDLQTLCGLAFFAVVGSQLGRPQPAWAEPASAESVCQQDIANLDTAIVDEASGLALAQGGGFFVMNDSGDKPRFFRVNAKGQELVEIGIADWKPFDPEALRVGPCPTVMSGSCLAVADIGDNRDRRKFVEVAFFQVDRLKTVAKSAALKPDRVLRFRYPDGGHNAEGFGLLSSSRLLVVTKEQDRKSRKAKPARVYTVELTEAQGALNEAMAKFQGEWNVPEWVADHGLGGLVTDLDLNVLANDRLRVLLLTYGRVVEVDASWTLGRLTLDSKRIYRVDSMEQQEAISYDEQKQGFYFTSEAPLAALRWLGARDKAKMPIRYVRPEACGEHLK